MCNLHSLRLAAVALCALAVACSDDTGARGGDPLAPVFAEHGGADEVRLARLGGFIFADTRLSVNANQACQTCHEPSEGFAAALPGVTTQGSVVEGSVPGMFGNRKPPTAAYATLAPDFRGVGNPFGGLFWDGRATGAVLGTPAADQALGPFLNPKEHALPDRACVAYVVRTGPYYGLYRRVWGDDLEEVDFADAAEVCSVPAGEEAPQVALSAADRERIELAYANMALSIAAFEGTFNRFSSAFDQRRLNAGERLGLRLFSGKANCHQCHVVRGTRPAFTDFRYENLGVPKNPDNPDFDYATEAFDPGLGGITGVPFDIGKFRTPTLRNVGLGVSRTYMHNGALETLRQVVDFLNTRDVLRTCTELELETLDPAEYGSYGAGCWPPPEYAANVDARRRVGHLGLSEQEVDALVAFLMALTDR